MIGNIWTAGLDALGQSLAEREAARLLEEDRARRATLDAESRGFRERELAIGEGSLEERRRSAAAEAASRTEAAGAAQAREARLAALLQRLGTVTDPQERYVLESEILTLGGKVGTREKPEKPTLRNVNPGDYVIDDTGKQIFKAPDRPPAPGSGRKTGIPTSVRRYVEEFSTTGAPIEEARAMLSRQWPNLQKQADAEGFDVSLADVAAYLTRIYPQTDPITRETAPMGVAEGKPTGVSPAITREPAPAPAPAPGVPAPSGENPQYEAAMDRHLATVLSRATDADGKPIRPTPQVIAQVKAAAAQGDPEALEIVKQAKAEAAPKPSAFQLAKVGG